MRPSAKYGLKCVTVVTPTPFFGGGFTKKQRLAVYRDLGPGALFERLPHGVDRLGGHFLNIVPRIQHAYP